MNMNADLNPTHADNVVGAELNANKELLNELDALLDEPASDGEEVAALSDELGEAAIAPIDEGAVADALRAHYEETGNADSEVSERDKPKTDADAEVVPETPKKRGRKAAAPKEPKAPSVYFHSHSKSEVIAHRLGADLKNLSFDTKDDLLDEAARDAKRASILEAIDKGAKKVGEKAVMLLAGKGVEQEVLKRAFTVLARDGFLTTGDKGNLIQDLLKKPYSTGTARSQANQIFVLFPLLCITSTRVKGRQDANESSTILARELAKLGLTLNIPS